MDRCEVGNLAVRWSGFESAFSELKRFTVDRQKIAALQNISGSCGRFVRYLKCTSIPLSGPNREYNNGDGAENVR